MSEKRNKKYKFVKREMASFRQNRSVSAIEAFRTTPAITSEGNINPVLSHDHTIQSFRFQSTETEITEVSSATAEQQRTAFANLKLINLLKKWSVEQNINHTQLNHLLKGLKDIFPEYKIVSKTLKRRFARIASDSDSGSDEVGQMEPTVTHITQQEMTALHRQYSEIKFELKQIFEKLEAIERVVSTNAVIISHNNSTIMSGEDETDFLNNLPMASVQEIQEFDAKISESSGNFNLLVQLLYLVGGETNKKIIFNMMRKLLKNEAAISFSSQGRKHKLSFMNLKLYDAVSVASRKRQATITDEEIKRIVSLFLATAPSRLKHNV